MNLEIPTTDVSIVIPLYNEEESVAQLYAALQETLSQLQCTAEVIVVDDGSTDGSLALLRKIAANDANVRVISLRRNFGQTAAFSAGFDFARGDVIVTMDADLQNDPNDIPLLLEEMAKGYDIVSGWRKDRKDRFWDRRLPSILANRLISNVTDVILHDYGCSLKAYRRDALQQVRLYGEMHRFIPALVSQIGARVTEVPVTHRAREFGSSKYGIGRTVRVVLDLLTVWFLGSYATRPLHVFGGLGLGATGLGILLGIYLTFLKIALGQDIGNRPLLLLAVLLVMVGAQLITMGLIAEMIIRTYHESQHKPIYSVREVLASDAAKNESVLELT